MRSTSITRTTKETDITLTLTLDGRGESTIQSGCGFLDHMLTLFAKHGGFDLKVTCDGDTYVDDHHTVEDIGIVLGEAFAKALSAEGCGFYPGCNYPLHRSSVFYDVDIYGDGKPTARRYLPEGVDPRKLTGELPVASSINHRVLGEPWFKHCDKAMIDRHVEAVHKVVENYHELLEHQMTDSAEGSIALSHRKS